MLSGYIILGPKFSECFPNFLLLLVLQSLLSKEMGDADNEHRLGVRETPWAPASPRTPPPKATYPLLPQRPGVLALHCGREPTMNCGTWALPSRGAGSIGSGRQGKS